MADKSIFELTLQTTFASNDRLVVGNYANSDAEAITGQTLVNLLATSLDGHGGIQSITKTSSTGTDPVVDTYTITMADQSTTTFTVTNGLKGDTGLQTFIYFRWAHTEPSSWSDTTSQPDDWMGVYAGTATTPPTTVSAYTWVQVKGDTGETGTAASIVTQEVTYMESTSGTVVPSGSWATTIPSVTPGNFLWTRTMLQFNDGSIVTSYSVSRYGIDGTGSVSTVNGVSPDVTGNIALTASNIQTLDNQSIQAHITDAESDIADINTALSGKQATLVSGTNIKTLNGQSVLGSGDLSVGGQVHVGTSAPSDPNIQIWLDTDEPGMSSVSSVNGATGTVVLDAEDVGAMSEWELLWTNASPGSNFSNQTISLDLTGYDCVLLDFSQATSSSGNHIYTEIAFIDGKIHMCMGNFSGSITRRVVTVSTTGVSYGVGEYPSDYNPHNDLMIPLHIYGSKGVQT